MYGHWFPPQAPCTTVDAVLCMLYCGIASLFDSFGNLRTELNVMFRTDSYYFTCS